MFLERFGPVLAWLVVVTWFMAIFGALMMALVVLAVMAGSAALGALAMYAHLRPQIAAQPGRWVQIPAQRDVERYR